MSGPVLSPEHEIRSYLAERVAEGFDSEEDIVESALEYFVEELEEKPELKELISPLTSELISKHLECQKTWQTPTDCDRLDSAFEELELNGIVCRQNFTCCQTCGHAEIWEEIEQAKQEGLAVSGYVFFHQQDTERVLEEERLFLAYGSVDNTDEATLNVAKTVFALLSERGFKLDWNGSLDKRLCVESLHWQKRRLG